jgi:hypothetical protein
MLRAPEASADADWDAALAALLNPDLPQQGNYGQPPRDTQRPDTLQSSPVDGTSHRQGLVGRELGIPAVEAAVRDAAGLMASGPAIEARDKGSRGLFRAKVGKKAIEAPETAVATTLTHGGDSHPPAEHRTAHDDPDERGRAELIAALGEHGRRTVEAFDAGHRAINGYQAVVASTDPFVRRDKASLEVTALPDTTLRPRALSQLRKIITTTEADSRGGGFFTPLVGADETGAVNAHITLESIIKEGYLAIESVHDNLGRIRHQADAASQPVSAGRTPRVEPDFFDRQLARLRVVAGTIPSRRVCEVIVQAYSQEIDKTTDRWAATTAIPLPLTSQWVQNWIRKRNVAGQEAGRKGARLLPQFAATTTEFGSEVHESLRAEARVQELLIVNNRLAWIDRARSELSTPANKQAVITEAETAESLRAADAYLTRQLDGALAQARLIGVDLEKSRRVAAFIKKLRANALVAVAETVTQDQRREQTAGLSADVTLAGRVLNGGTRLGTTGSLKTRARGLADSLRQVATVGGHEPQPLFTQPETGVIVAIDQGGNIFDRFLTTVERVATGAPADEDLTFVGGQAQLADVLRLIRGVQLRPLLESLAAKLADGRYQIALDQALTGAQRTAIDRVLAGYLHPELETATAGADSQREPEADVATGQTTDDRTPQPGSEATDEDSLDGAPTIEVTAEAIIVGGKEFPRIDFEPLESFHDLRPMEHLGDTVLPDQELTTKTDSKEWDAIDRAIDEIIKQAQARALHEQERARQRGRPIPPIPEADPTRIDVLRRIEQIWDGPTRWARGSLRDKRRYLVDGELQVDEYIVLVLGVRGPDGEIIGEHSIAETPLKNISAMYLTRYDIPGYQDFNWRDVLTVPRRYARYFGARKLTHREREGEPLNTTMFKKAMSLLLCRPGAFRTASIRELEAELTSSEE